MCANEDKNLKQQQQHQHKKGLVASSSSYSSWQVLEKQIEIDATFYRTTYRIRFSKHFLSPTGHSGLGPVNFKQ